MTKDEALKMAIEALEDASCMAYSEFSIENEYKNVINACKEALDTEQVREDLPAQLSGNSEQLKQDHSADAWKIGEPVAWLYKREKSDGGWYVVTNYEKENDRGSRNIQCYDIPLYTHPHQWQGLSDDEIDYLMYQYCDTDNGYSIKSIIKLVEQILERRNNHD